MRQIPPPTRLLWSAFFTIALIALAAALTAGPVARPRVAHAAPLSPLAAPASPAVAQTHRSAAAAACRAVYVVRPGDWLARIAPRYGTTWPRLATANHLPNPNVITPGERLCVPASSRHVAATKSAPAHGTHHPGAVGKAPKSPPSASYGAGWVMRPGEPCYGHNPMAAFHVARLAQYAVPAGCFGGVYREPWAVNGYRPLVAWGQCSSWPAMLHRVPWPSAAGRYHTTPRPGAIVYWTPRMNHSNVGHYAEVVVVRSDGWLLISEANMYWRGGGWARVLYQFIPPWSARGLLYLY